MSPIYDPDFRKDKPEPPKPDDEGTSVRSGMKAMGGPPPSGGGIDVGSGFDWSTLVSPGLGMGPGMDPGILVGVPSPNQWAYQGHPAPQPQKLVTWTVHFVSRGVAVDLTGESSNMGEAIEDITKRAVMIAGAF